MKKRFTPIKSLRVSKDGAPVGELFRAEGRGPGKTHSRDNQKAVH